MNQESIRFKNFNWGFLFALAINYSWLLFLCIAFVETEAGGAVLALVVLAGLYLLALTPFVDWYYRWIIGARKQDGIESERIQRIWRKICFVEAKAKLGICYLEGKGTERNEQAAFQYLYEAVDAKCYHTAGYPLAKCYIYGIGTDTDTEAGLKLLKQAIEADCDDLEEAKVLLIKKQQQRDRSQ